MTNLFLWFTSPILSQSWRRWLLSSLGEANRIQWQATGSNCPAQWAGKELETICRLSKKEFQTQSTRAGRLKQAGEGLPNGLCCCHSFSCSCGWSQLTVLWWLAKFWLSVPHLPPPGWAFLLSIAQELPPFPVEDEESAVRYQLGLSLITLRTSLLPREFIHSFDRHSWGPSMCHILVIGTWGASVNRIDRNPCPQGVLHCSKGRQQINTKLK